MAHNDYDGLLEWLPLEHARISHDHHKQTKGQFGFGMQQEHRHEIKSPPTTTSSAEVNYPSTFRGQWRFGQRTQAQGGRKRSNWASGGPGMQAIFLGSSPKSGGTGVFLPRTEGTDFQFTNKPAISPVLLPARVVQALNLNVHEIGHQIKPQPDQNKNIAKKVDKTSENKKEGDVCLSPEIFLPKEWTY